MLGQVIIKKLKWIVKCKKLKPTNIVGLIWVVWLFNFKKRNVFEGWVGIYEKRGHHKWKAIKHKIKGYGRGKSCFKPLNFLHYCRTILLLKIALKMLYYSFFHSLVQMYKYLRKISKSRQNRQSIRLSVLVTFLLLNGSSRDGKCRGKKRRSWKGGKPWKKERKKETLFFPR